MAHTRTKKVYGTASLVLSRLVVASMRFAKPEGFPISGIGFDRQGCDDAYLTRFWGSFAISAQPLSLRFEPLQTHDSPHTGDRLSGGLYRITAGGSRMRARSAPTRALSHLISNHKSLSAYYCDDATLFLYEGIEENPGNNASQLEKFGSCAA